MTHIFTLWEGCDTLHQTGDMQNFENSDKILAGDPKL